jgi:hypothetical protein
MRVITLDRLAVGAHDVSAQDEGARPSQRNRAALSDGETYGPPELCAWQIAPGVFWIQTTEPRFSRKLEKRRDARRVEISGVNHFRRTFEIHGSRRKIQRIIDRFLMSARDHFSGDFRPQRASKKRGSITIAGGHNGRK